MTAYSTFCRERLRNVNLGSETIMSENGFFRGVKLQGPNGAVKVRLMSGHVEHHRDLQSASASESGAVRRRFPMKKLPLGIVC
jgi:hypothetical protein